MSLGKVRLIVKCFCADITASQTSKIVGVNRKTADRYFNQFRYLIIKDQLKNREKIMLKNGIEIDESYFGARRVRGKRGRGSASKIIVLGLLKRNGNVYTQIISDASRIEIMPVIKRVVESGSDIYTDGWKSYDALAVYGYNHKKVKHTENEFVNGSSHINGVESFWSWLKRRLAKFNGVPKDRFGINLLECEWRFNHRKNIEKFLKQLIL
ncbi:IS1595 family transposase ISTaba1 [Candidatus Roizmanbacteria bacterium CG10_big_fil_rev_8_21_14_0_10_39_6]|uniref:IS1595 family transposase ISTaba1 n=1 Tax=Candidatus Roizmanbacteria bacterium CG10_big_fil_rev_8_21_14_0_10_39_6 TaxID=1974853 RepID=A0A2M8KTL9_9BACT|nr:MAG: IS1595 family transposase ISTaba1 [Candidatus Roizmanbacteria bacterium CG10_big_fil_rev_8_21_14_0_10_39_6]